MAQRGLWRAMLAYGALIALFAFILAWMDWRHLSRQWSTEFYVVGIALVFAALGIWLGHQLTPKAPAAEFARNERALASLGISPRECDVLERLAAGRANKVIARELAISPNTVKTHLARLFEKLGVSNRTEAIARARELGILP